MTLFCLFQLKVSQFWQDRRFVAAGAPNADPSKKNPKRKYKEDGPEPPFKFSAHQPMATGHDILRLHRLIQHADFLETSAIHPRYETQAAYFARVPSTGRPVALLQVPCQVSRGSFHIAEQLSGVMWAVALSQGHGKRPYFALASVINKFAAADVHRNAAQAEMCPNHFTTRGRYRVHSVLIGTHGCHWGVVFLIARVRTRLWASPSHSELRE